MSKISIIVPIYGVEKYIEKCARSLFEQSFGDIEYLFVNDCTKDLSMEVLTKVMDDYPLRIPQVKIVNMIKNSGQAVVRESALQLASGDYIFSCDGDDWIANDTCKQMYEAAMQNNADIVFCDFNYYNENKCRHELGNFGDLTNKNSVLMHVAKYQQWQLCRALFKRKLLIDNPIIYPKANNGEDFALMFQLLCYAERFVHIPLPLYYYRYNPNSITNSASEEKYLYRLDQHVKNVILLESFLQSIKNVPVEVKTLIMTILKLNARYLISYLAHKNKYRKVWNNTFPELENERILFNKFIPFYLKKNYFSTKLCIYNFLRHLKSYFNN